jgi:hypothetical protein
VLYARVDLVPTPDGPALMELELTEPHLFFAHAPGSADRLAAAIARRITWFEVNATDVALPSNDDGAKR